MPLDAPTAFFSYSRNDSEFVLKLAQDLRDAGACVWLDQLDIEPGQEWDSAVEEAVRQCQRMLLILSPASVSSKNVRNEIAFALDENKIIIPVLCQDAAIPLQLRRIQHIDFRTDYAHGLKILLKSLGEGPQAAESMAATNARVEGQPVASEAERKRAAEWPQLEDERRQSVEHKARLEQQDSLRLEQAPDGAPALSPTIVFPNFKKIALSACGILVLGLVLYWAMRSKQPQGGIQTPALQTLPSNPTPSAQVPSSSAAAGKGGCE
ncbi:MAG TPA: TIR domain-containing protein [Terriglobales bacterium]